MSELKNKYIEAVKHYNLLKENWNTAISKNVTLPDWSWDKALEEMEKARDNAKNAWSEYMNKELLKGA